MEALRVRSPSAGARPSARWQKLKKKGHPVSPVVIEGRTIASTFWGKAWCDNLERYSDFANRLPRGRTYVRNGSVVDLQIAPGEVEALVSGSELYTVKVKVAAGAKGPVACHLHGLRGRHRLAGGAAAGALLQGRDGAHLPAEDRPVPGAERDRVLVQLPGLGVDVQARRGRALRHRRAARRASPSCCSGCARWTRRNSLPRAGRAMALSKKGPAAEKVLAADGLSDLFGLEMDEGGDGAPSESTPAASRPAARTGRSGGAAKRAGEKAASERGRRASKSAGKRDSNGKPAKAAPKKNRRAPNEPESAAPAKTKRKAKR